MPRYKSYSYEQSVMLPIHFDEQILSGSIEEAIHYIVDNHIDMRAFEERYKNEDGGAPAYDPKVLLKILLLAYSRGITGSREIEHLCRENIVFMAISAETKPDHATIAGFVSRMDKEVQGIFRDVLLICYEIGLLDGKLYAIDGCKIPSNASKEWSGSRADYEKKKRKIEATIQYLITQHKQHDINETDPGEKQVPVTDHERRIRKLEKKVEKIKRWMKENEDKIGAHGKVKKSNITDNESAKMPSSHGVIQGYNGIAVVDEKHQIIVEAQAHGEGQEQKVFKQVLEGTEKRLEEIGKGKESLKEVKIITDSGFHNKENVNIVEEKGLDAYIPDKGFRRRDPRFKDAKRHWNPVDGKKTQRRNKWYKVEDFKYDEEKKKMICPAGKQMYIRNRNYEYKGRKAIAYMARETDCRRCALRNKCIRKKQTTARQIHVFYDYEGAENKVLKKMKEKIDSVVGRHIYSLRMKIVEPVFGNMRNNIGLLKFSLRGGKKVGVQWQIFAIVHNIGKIARYGYGFT